MSHSAQISKNLIMMHVTEHTIIVKNVKGAYARIDFSPSNKGV